MVPKTKELESKKTLLVTNVSEGMPTEISNIRKRDEFGSQRTLYDVAELFFVKRMRNKDIAEKLKISSSEVTRLKNKAMEKGILDVKLKIAWSELLHVMENHLISKFHLQDARIVLDSSAVDVTERIGREASDYLDRQGMIASGSAIGVGGGAPLAYLAHHLNDASRRLQQLRIYPLVATSTLVEGKIVPDPYPCSRSATFIAFEAANRLKGGPNGPENIEVFPIFATSPGESPDPYEKVLMEIADSQGIIITGSTIVDEEHSAGGILRRLQKSCPEEKVEDVKQLQSKGAVVLASGRFYDADGIEVSSNAYKLMAALSLRKVKELNNRRQRKLTHILVSGCKHRRSALMSIIKGGTVTHFVTDYGTASKLLADDDDPITPTE